MERLLSIAAAIITRFALVLFYATTSIANVIDVFVRHILYADSN